jgi:hypothetical protein
MKGEKIEVTVPDGYRLKQDGIYIEFVIKSRDKWGIKDKISGYYINKNSKIVDTVYSQRAEKHGNIFHTESQAKGMISVAKLSQQLADFNGDWKPDWGNKNETKYCIYHRCRNNSLDEFTVSDTDTLYRFLAFKTELDAKEFLDTNIKEIRLAKDFI